MAYNQYEVSEVSNGIKVTVTPFYHANVSKPSLDRFLHSYDVVIENLSPEVVQLISRHWIITDGDGNVREVKGDGVIGEQPILHQDEMHSYNSWCPLKSPIGKMSGTYTMMRLSDQSVFNIIIPEFKLIADFVMN